MTKTENTEETTMVKAYLFRRDVTEEFESHYLDEIEAEQGHRPKFTLYYWCVDEKTHYCSYWNPMVWAHTVGLRLENYEDFPCGEDIEMDNAHVYQDDYMSYGEHFHEGEPQGEYELIGEFDETDDDWKDDVMSAINI